MTNKMKGNIIKRGADSYTFVVSYKDSITGERRQRWETVKGNSKQARDRYTEVKNEINKGIYVRPGKQMLRDYLLQWLQNYEPNLAVRTFKAYEFDINRHLIPAIGNIPLSGLQPENLQRMYADKLKSGRKDGSGGLGDKAVKHMHVVLHRALKSAVKLGMLSRNPADFVDVPKITQH